MKTNDGGPAFPCEQPEVYEPGMSLRDYAAIKFAAAWVVALSMRHNEPGYSDTDCLFEANTRGLEQADAMIKAREEI